MFENYRVAVRLALISDVGVGLTSLAGQFQGLNKHISTSQAQVAELEKSLQRLKQTGLIGGALAAAGGAGLAMFKGPLEEATKLDQQIQKFKLFGMGDKVNTEAVQFAKGMNIIGSSYTENMKLMIEAQGVFRESGKLTANEQLEGAKLAAPYLAKIAFATKSLDDESAAKLKHSSMAMLRYVEDSGGLASPQKFQSLADAGWKMVQTSGGSVDWEQLRQFKTRAGVAGMNLSGDAMAEMEPIITMLKGQTAGFSLRTAYNRLNGIVKIPNQVAHELVNSGIWDGNKVIWNAMGGIKSFKGNPLQDSELFSTNSIEYYEKHIMPLHAKMGIKTDAQIAQANAMMFGSTGGNMFTLIDKNLAKLHQSLEAQNKALGVDASVDVAGKGMNGKLVDLHAKWDNVLADLGNTVLPLAISMTTRLTAVLSKLSEFAKEHPTLTKTIVLIGGTTAALALLGGTALLAATGIKGLNLVLGGLPAKLSAVSGAIKFMGTAAFAFLALADAWQAITTGKSVSYDAVNMGGAALTGDKNFNLGSWIYEKTHSDPLSFVRPAATQHLQVKTELHVDGKKMAENTTMHQVKAGNRPTGGTSGFDGRMSYAPAGISLGN